MAGSEFEKKLAARERGACVGRAYAMSSGLYRLLIASGVVFVLSLALAIFDALEWVVLPQPMRPFIPIVLVASTLLGIVLLSGSIGIPKNPRLPAEDEASGEEPDLDTPEVEKEAPARG